MKITPSPPGRVPRKLPTSTDRPDPLAPVKPQTEREAAHVAAVLGMDWRIKKIWQEPTLEFEPPSAETALLAEACALIYQPPDIIRARLNDRGFCDPELFQTSHGRLDDAHRVRALGFCDNERIFVVFRGTRGCRDWCYNLNIWVRNTPPRHAGFQRVWDEVALSVRDWLETRVRAGRVLHLSGHSLGGAIATIAASELAAQVPIVPIDSVVTLGSPRVGGKMFAEHYASQPATLAQDGTSRTLTHVTRRYKHGTDIVVRFPLPYLRHVVPAIPLPALALGDAESHAQYLGYTLTLLFVMLLSRLPGGWSNLLYRFGEPGELGKQGAWKLIQLGKQGAWSIIHHQSLIYATILSPTHILGDLNLPLKRPSLWPFISCVCAAITLALFAYEEFGGWYSVLWVVGVPFAIVVIMGVVAGTIEMWRERQSRTGH